MGSNQIEAYCRKYKEKMNEPIVRNFLKDKENYALFQEAILNPTEENTSMLNNAFAEYYRKVKVINYISNLVYFYSIDFDKRISLYKKRNLFSLTVPHEETDKSLNNLDALTSSEEDLTYNDFENMNKKDDLKDHIDDDLLYKALDVLSDKQIRILTLMYLNDHTNKEVAEILNESVQTISYNHNKALSKIKEFMEGTNEKEK
ncbi:sigma-70 family RNA polymerase sigma factor [Bacillus pseudomycoides]|jgi:RNA polymerase sigma factor (sigma-70 family)|uniref:sigma-70 family RNA polymerase sigma factor n=1 Tax=Bacillus pseudomycoides TaxID=64104 RepID=UPI000BEB6570|nr:sigma-70 family RNA polymerase sigma factor [Bacillus pseudomycoides]PEE04999.1 RNA polymerase subunit sigma-70 [Bacillus pseudomycoides]PEM78525.1 RNA polymerase subunit sigma-70 [Bacillus pseudomycoides]PHC85246.1 RNA polymerase subunit sigma-70 [Bacillus pseudomycoides]